MFRNVKQLNSATHHLEKDCLTCDTARSYNNGQYRPARSAKKIIFGWFGGASAEDG